MKATVIIAHNAKREDALLNRCIESVKAEGITDIIVETEGNKSEARNAGALKASKESLIYVFLDDDVVLRPGCVNELIAPFSDNKVALVSGVNIMFPNAGRGERISSTLLASKLTMFRSASRYTPTGFTRETDESELISAIMAVRKDAFFKAGEFPVHCIPAEENVLINNIQKLGLKTVYCPFAIVFHNRPDGLVAHWRKIYEYGTGRGRMLRQFRFEGRPRMLFKPSRDWVLLFIGAIGHYIAYLLGVLRGLLKD